MTHLPLRCAVLLCALVLAGACDQPGNTPASACDEYYGPDGCCLALAGGDAAAESACAVARDEAAAAPDRFESQCRAVLDAARRAGQCGGAADASTGPPACDFPKSQTVSEPCCTELGVDACGAGLFGAAFDGRTQATCYAVRSRPDGAECAADQHCTSGACHPDLRRCKALPHR